MVTLKRLLKKYKWIAVTYLLLLGAIVVHGTARVIRVATNADTVFTTMPRTVDELSTKFGAAQQQFVEYDTAQPQTLLEHQVVFVIVLIVVAPFVIGWVAWRSWRATRRFIAARSQDQASAVQSATVQ